MAPSKKSSEVPFEAGGLQWKLRETPKGRFIECASAPGGRLSTSIRKSDDHVLRAEAELKARAEREAKHDAVMRPSQHREREARQLREAASSLMPESKEQHRQAEQGDGGGMAGGIAVGRAVCGETAGDKTFGGETFGCETAGGTAGGTAGSETAGSSVGATLDASPSTGSAAR
jgi:hypothetical protein